MPISDRHSSIALVVVTWNGWPDTRRCLASIEPWRAHIGQLFLVDNGSADGTPVLVKERFPWAVVMEQHENLGFAGGANVGMAAALRSGAAYVCILNNDTVASVDFLSPLVRKLESDRSLAAVSPRIDELGSGSSWFVGTEDDDAGVPMHTTATPPTIVPAATRSLTGCCMTFRREALESVGLFDERLFLIFEDADWSARAVSAGWRLAVVPDVVIQHAVSASFGRAGTRVGHFYYCRNGLAFVRRHRGVALAARFCWRECVWATARALTYRRADEAVGRVAGGAAFILRQWGRAPWWVQQRR